MSEKFSSVLIIATRQIGDTLITTPLIERARHIWPHAKIDFLGFDNAIGILEGNPFLNDVIGMSPKPKRNEYFALFKRLFRKYDLAIITQPSDRAYLFGFFSAKQRVGVIHLSEKGNFWKRLITSHQVVIDYFNQHVITEKLKLLGPFSRVDMDQLAVNVTPPISNNESDLPESMTTLARSSIVIHPCPLNSYKRWPLSNWIALIEHITQNNCHVLISGGPQPIDLELGQNIVSKLSPFAQSKCTDLSGKYSFSQLSQILTLAKAYVGIDTSVSHLAAASGIKTVVLFGPTPPTNFGPWPNGHNSKQPFLLKSTQQTVDNITILQGPGSCVPCRKAGCEDKADSKSDCLDHLTLESVMKALHADLSHPD